MPGNPTGREIRNPVVVYDDRSWCFEKTQQVSDARVGRIDRGWLERNWHRVVVHVVCITALLYLAYMYFLADLPIPVRFVMLRAGTFGLILLVASFACTPVARLTHWAGAIQIRRALGLYGFLFVAIHLLAYAYGDNEFDLELILRDLDERRSMLIGTLSFVLLIPLALTSTRGWQRRLGRRWKVLHRLVYIALPLAVLHYLWLDRDFIELPLLYAGAVAVLFLLRWILMQRGRNSDKNVS